MADSSRAASIELDEAFQIFTARDTRMLLLAGYNFTGSTIFYGSNLLSKAPQLQARFEQRMTLSSELTDEKPAR